jgi:pyruvate formate-lyase/glycerol dehydratase family glycyl radical enzyme
MAIASATRDIDTVNALTKRVEKLKQEVEGAKSYASSQTSRSFTTSWKETEGQPLDLRRAKSYARILKDTPIIIRDGELIVGSISKYIRASAPVPTVEPALFLKKLENRRLKRMRSATDPSEIEPEEERILREDALFWDKYLPREDYLVEEMRRQLGEGYFELLRDRARVFDLPAPQRELMLRNAPAPTLNLRILRDGLNSVIARARAEQKNMSSQSPHVPAEGYHKHILLDSMIIACEAVIEFAKKHAELARKLASEESDPLRKRELEEIALRCDWVPANSPRSFAEALQSLQFLLIGLLKDPSGDITSLGRLDLYLYPYYKKDLSEGIITRQEAAELLGCMLVKVNEADVIIRGNQEDEIAAGGAFLTHITLGGRTKEGKDATNELSYLILDVVQQLKYANPAVYIRYHDGMKKDFLIKALEVNRDLANPSFLNDQLGTARFLARGVNIDDAVDWEAVGCLEYEISHVFSNRGFTGDINLAKIFELTLNNGFDPRTGKSLGLQTGDVSKFTRIEQFYEAFEKQFEWFVDIALKAYFVRNSITTMEQGNHPLGSVMIEDCITKGLGPQEGGCERYPGIISVGVGHRGCTDVADSLTAIKKLVFEDKKMTMVELMDALKNNWEGKSNVYQACLRSPKYGNDDDYADEMFNYLSLKIQEIILKKRDPITGRQVRSSRLAGPAHVPNGEVVGALPNGRKAWSPLNDAALSPMPGADVKGPTAVINSATKANHSWEEWCITLNMKFSRPLLSTQQKLDNLLSLIKTFFDRGGWHIQFNILNADDLIDAKKHPEKWRNLIVRIAGYSAFFVDLAPNLQDEIIARTMHEV